MPLDQEQIRAKVLDIIKILAPETDTGNIVSDLPLRKQIDLDSMDWLNVLEAIRERIGVDVPETDYGKLGTLDNVVAYLANRLAES
jgi:acyl carrier protein